MRIEVPDGVEIPLLLGSELVDLTVPVYREAARADAALTGVSCGGETAAGQAIVDATTGGLGAYLGEVDDAQLMDRGAAPTVTPAVLVDVAGLARVTGSSTVEVGGTAATLTFTGPFDAGNTQRVSGGMPDVGLSLADAANLDVEVLGVGLLADDVLNAVDAAVDDILANLDTGLLDRVAGALGLSVADADVGAFDLRCAGRSLVQ